MSLPSGRILLLFLCTCSAYATLGRAPGAVNLRTREIESAIQAEGKPGRDKREIPAWLGGHSPT